MPYVYRDELLEGETAADVVERDVTDSIADERDAAIKARDAAIGERDSLMRELDEAKAKFANAFLTTPVQAKAAQAEDARKESRIQTFDELFKGRNANAN